MVIRLNRPKVFESQITTHESRSDRIIGNHSGDSNADQDPLFAQVQINENIVDTKPNCGNMLVAVGPFAIEAGLVPAKNGETLVRIFNVNTQSLVEAIVQTPGGHVSYEG